jgi:hypothetical protein
VWGYHKKTRLFEDIFKEMEASIRYKAFSKITRLFEDILNKIEAFLKWCGAFSKNSRLF